MLSWHWLYLSSALASEQLLSTCLFDCTFSEFHNLHIGLSIFFHRWRLDAVGSCWIRAFRAKPKMYCGIESRVEDQTEIFCLPIDPVTDFTIKPWVFSEKRCVCAVSSWCLRRLLRADMADTYITDCWRGCLWRCFCTTNHAIFVEFLVPSCVWVCASFSATDVRMCHGTME